MAIAKRKKKFWDIDMPLLKKATQLYSFTLEELNGRIIKYDLSRILRGKNAILKLNVITTKDSATTTPREIQLLPYFLKKMVRKGTNYVEDSFKTECKDATLTIKPFLVTRRKVSRAVRKALRVKAREELTAYAKKHTAEEIFEDLLRNGLQKPLSLKLKKTYPLSLCEIRVIKVESPLKPTEKKKEAPKKEMKEEKTKKKLDEKIDEDIKAASQTKSLEENPEQKSKVQLEKPKKAKSPKKEEKSEETSEEQ